MYSVKGKKSAKGAQKHEKIIYRNFIGNFLT